MHYVTILRIRASKMQVQAIRLRKVLMTLRRIQVIIIYSTRIWIIQKSLILIRDRFHLIRKIRRKAVLKTLSPLLTQAKKLKILNKTLLRKLLLKLILYSESDWNN
jgi:hypothetical protein